MDFKTVYVTLYLLFLCILSVSVIFNRKLNLAILGFSIFFQRYNIFIPTINKSFQLIFLLGPLVLLTNIIEDIKSTKGRNLKSKLNTYLTDQLKLPFVKWVIVLLTIDFITIFWAYDLKFSLMGFLLRLITLSTSLAIYLELRKHPKSIKFFIVGLLSGQILNLLISYVQHIDCLKNNCQMFNIIESNLLEIKCLLTNHQKIHLGDKVYSRLYGMFGDTNMHGFILGAIILLNLSLLINAIIKVKNDTKAILNVILVLILAIFLVSSLGALILTFSRSAIISFVIVASITTIYIFIKMTFHKKNFIISTILLLPIIFLTITINIGLNKFPEKTNRVADVLENKFDYKTEGSAVQHILIMKEAHEIGTKGTHYMGTGIGSYQPYYPKYFNSTITDRDPHSWIALLFAEEGILGILVYPSFFLYMLISIIRIVIKRKFTINSLDITFMLIPFIFILGMTFYYGFFIPMTWIWFGIANCYIDIYNRKL